jgi:hypothetical protein
MFLYDLAQNVSGIPCGYQFMPARVELQCQTIGFRVSKQQLYEERIVDVKTTGMLLDRLLGTEQELLQQSDTVLLPD